MQLLNGVHGLCFCHVWTVAKLQLHRCSLTLSMNVNGQLQTLIAQLVYGEAIGAPLHLVEIFEPQVDFLRVNNSSIDVLS